MIMLLSFATPPRAFGQLIPEDEQSGSRVSGVVTAADNTPLIGVGVMVKGTGMGATTGVNGEYTVYVPAGDHTLIFSYMGFEEQQIGIDGRTTLNVVLAEASSALDEVIVVGYGVQKKINQTGAVSAIDGSKLENRPSPTLATSLAGLSSGVSITQQSGNPGSENVSFTIRGIGSFNGSSPMILVDGVEAAMNSVNPEDVASISILKDGASAAIYGSRAANGVILITTKKGSTDSPTRVTYSNVFAVQQAQTDWSQMSDMPTWMEWHNQAQINNNPSIVNTWYDQYTIDTWRAANANPNGTDNGYGIPNWMAYPNTDWAQVLFQPSFYQKHNLSVSGGSKTGSFLLSAGYQDNPGTFENTGQQRYNIRVNGETKAAGFLTFGTQTYLTKTVKDPGDVTAAFRYLTQAYPGINPKIDGLYGASEDPNMTNMNNPLRQIASTGGSDKETTINTTWYTKADIWNGLSAEVKFNYQNIFYDQERYTKNVPSYRFRNGTEEPVENIVAIENATTQRASRTTESYLLDLMLYYNKSFGGHEINALAGYEQTEWSRSAFSATGQGFLDWPVTDITAASEMQSIGGEALVEYGMLSYFGRVNYNYKSKYLFEANFRADASSRYSPENRWGYFPSFSAGWRISEEGFFSPLKNYISDLKIRASWGKLGNTINDGYYAWQALYGKVDGVLNQSVSTGLAQTQPPNYELAWETVTTKDVGVDVGFLRNRLNLSVDYYERMSSDILDRPTLPLAMGSMSGTQWLNTAEMVNKGVEFTVAWNDRIGKLRYFANFNAAYNTNMVTKFRGSLEYGQLDDQYDVWGRPAYGYTNLSDVSTNSGNTYNVEGRMYNEFYLNTPYSGTGTYYTASGQVDPNGGPTDGMIRSKADLEWVQAMINAGYSFAGVEVGSPVVDANGNLTGGSGSYFWYGDQIMADVNGDGIYGDSNDKIFTGKSATPKWMFGFNLGAEWKGFDFSMTWDARVGSYAYVNVTGLNGNITQNTDAINADAASMYYTYDAYRSVYDYDNYDPIDDPNANTSARYPRLLSVTSKTPANTLYLLNTSYLKLRSVQIGYTLPRKWVDRLKLDRVRVFVAGENLLTIAHKDFVGVDPELGNAVNVYPISRMYSGGLTVTF